MRELARGVRGARRRAGSGYGRGLRLSLRRPAIGSGCAGAVVRAVPQAQRSRVLRQPAAAAAAITSWSPMSSASSSPPAMPSSAPVP